MELPTLLDALAKGENVRNFPCAQTYPTQRPFYIPLRFSRQLPLRTRIAIDERLPKRYRDERIQASDQ